MQPQLNPILELFLADTKSDSVLIVNKLGDVLSQANSNDNKIIGAMANAIQSMSEQFTDHIELGLLKQIFIKTDAASILITAIDADRSSVVFCPTNINLGLIMRRIDVLTQEILDLK